MFKRLNIIRSPFYARRAVINCFVIVIVALQLMAFANFIPPKKTWPFLIYSMYAYKTTLKLPIRRSKSDIYWIDQTGRQNELTSSVRYQMGLNGLVRFTKNLMSIFGLLNLMIFLVEI